MNVYYILRYETFSDGEAQQLPRPALEGRSGMSFSDGTLVKDPPARIRFVMTAAERGVLGDYVLSGLPGLLISDRFRRALEEAGIDNVQYIPAEIEDEVAKESYENYFVANVLGVVDCIDLARSKITTRAAMPELIREIDELHIDEACARGLPLFRLGRRTTLVMINEALQKKLATAGLRGVGMVPAEGFST